MLPSLEEVGARFERACDLKQLVDRNRIERALLAWIGGISKHPVTVRFVETEKEAARAARDARAAWAARAARAAWAARAARAARAAWAAWDVRAAWAVRAAWDARDARDAWAARGAWDARAARGAWAVMAARDARAAWAARDAWDVRAARGARAAWAARDARGARDARDARDARGVTWDISWFCITAIGALASENEPLYRRWIGMLEAFEAGAFALWMLPDEIVVATLPALVSVDDQRRLHADSGPAFSFLGVDDYWHHGVLMPTEEARDHSKITAARIDKETNAEVRRVLIGWYGADRYLKDSGARIVHEDLDPLGNPRRLLWRDIQDDEPIVMVEVTDSTPQPDGVAKRYLLRVDPASYGGRAGRECHAAIASTWRHKRDRAKLFFVRPEDYVCRIET